MLGDVGTRHAESVYAFVIGHGMPCPYHVSALTCLQILDFAHLFVSLKLRF